MSAVVAIPLRSNNHSLVMRLIVLVPFESSMNSVEEPRLSRPELVLPTVSPRVEQPFVEVEELFVFVQVFGSFFSVQPFGCEVGERGRVDGLLDGGGTLGPGDKGRRGDEPTSGVLRKRTGYQCQRGTQQPKQPGVHSPWHANFPPRRR